MHAAALRAALCGVILNGAVAAAAAPPSVDYLYIEANEGDSSGGHVALRLGADAFHFQQEAGGFIRMRRDDANIFHFRYAMLGNRPIHESRIAASQETYTRLRDTFVRRLMVQNAQYARAEALQDDIDLLQLLRDPAHASVAVRGAGYFVSDGIAAAPPAARSPALQAVAEAVAAARGETFLRDRRAATHAALAAWQPRAERQPAPALALDAYPHFAATAATEYREQIEALSALEILAAAPALRQDMLRGDDRPLDAAQRTALARFAGQLSGSLATLAASPRSDFGYPLLLGMARLAAIEASLAQNRLVVLDAFADDAVAAPLPPGDRRGAYLAALAVQVAPAVDHARAEFFAAPHFREADYTQLETALNRRLEVERAAGGAPLRAERGILMPARAAKRRELVAPPLDAPSAAREIDAARVALADYQARLGELYRYNLITRNCVSEIFTTIDAAVGGDSDRYLGGAVRTDTTLNFIPVLSAAAVERNYTTVAQRTRPSYRQVGLAALQEADDDWRVALRESNTLTSTLYHAGPRDSAFLFFTDEHVALRPLLGIANVAVGLAQSTLGLVTWPSDDGARLRAGLRGTLFSLPELAFFNIRKGSMAWVEPQVVARAR